jgi:hypothetical protein
VPEADHVHRLILEGGDAAADRGPARAVAVHQPDPDAAHREELAPAEAPHQRRLIVVARHRLERRQRFEQARDVRPGEVAEMQDQPHPRSDQAALERGRQTTAEPGQVGVRDHPDVHRPRRPLAARLRGA